MEAANMRIRASDESIIRPDSTHRTIFSAIFLLISLFWIGNFSPAIAMDPGASIVAPGGGSAATNHDPNKDLLGETDSARSKPNVPCNPSCRTLRLPTLELALSIALIY